MSYLIKGSGFLIIILLCVFFYHGNINEFPQHIHGWSQSDRYALAIGFLNNGFDFFHPQTFNLNVQFEPADGLKKFTGITAVDFPIHEYLVAILMQCFGVSPWVFRCYTLLYALVGLYFLARICKQLGLDNLWALFMPVFVLTTPVFTYYANGFLPGITAWANASIGFYFYVLCLQHRQKKHWILALVFFTLAALTRTPFIMCLLAIGLVQLIYNFKSGHYQRMFWFYFIAAIAVIVGYTFYNNYLRKVYGSIFLSTPMPARNFAEFKQIAADIYKQWLFHYFSLAHYLVWLTFVFTLTVTIFKTKLNGWLGQFAYVQIVLLGGASCYALLMWRQMQQHDYYFI
ncbi:MAG TPA: glycosyltransferase family 39 protein, partial [Bacteroidia bacterium]|nr:glycosyltransferase family 39 protein [Bacteroidia bacterium]